MRSASICGKAVDDRAIDDRARRGGAFLARAHHRAGDDVPERMLEVGVGQHDGRVLAAQLELQLRPALGRGTPQFGAGLIRPREGDGDHPRVSHQRIADVRADPVTRLSTPAGSPASSSASTRRTAVKGRKAGRFEDDSVAEGQRGSDLPGRNGDREVPRRDHGHDPERLSGGVEQRVRVHRRVVLATRLLRLAIITPWNFPIVIPAWKIAPALAFGNTVVFKTGEPHSADGGTIGRGPLRGGVTAGVLNLVTGSAEQVGDPLVRDPRVVAISFTGSNVTGAALQAAGPPSGERNCSSSSGERTRP